MRFLWRLVGIVQEQAHHALLGQHGGLILGKVASDNEVLES